MLAEIRTELIKLAAEMVRGEGIPSDFNEDHPARRTRHYWLAQLERAHNSNKSKAMRLRAIFDKLSALEKQTEPACWKCPCCGNYYVHTRLVCPVSGDSRPALETGEGK